MIHNLQLCLIAVHLNKMFKLLSLNCILIRLFSSRPFDDSNFDSAVDFLKNRAHEEVNLITNRIVLKVAFPTLSGVTEEVSKKFPNVPKSVIAATINSG
jgi:hypothetical protein